MSQLLTAMVLTPLIGLIATVIMPKKWERAIFTTAMITTAAQFLLLSATVYHWIETDVAPISTTIGSLYNGGHYTFTLEFYLDKLSAIFLAVAATMTSLVFVFSRYYMHREPGFKRFYYTVLLFLTGLSLIILAGNFEVLLFGWELIGISSVLLIAFYRDRFLPARNALKVFSVYRIADAFLLAAIWYAHHVFHRSVTFSEFSNVAAQHADQMAILGLLLLGAALIKSAQFPFSYWLPRAMEGPTSSSAIFYGALSVHMGLFLLLRTYPLWEHVDWVRITIGLFGLTTAIIAAAIARVQSSIKTQIAYASITQIGIMFIEVALGLWWLAVIHFVSNALLRAYQLLISPSVVSYLVHDQFFYFVPPPQRIKQTLLGKIRATTYILSIKEWNMNTAMTDSLWRPLKSFGRLLRPLDKWPAQLAVSAILVTILAMLLVTSPTANIPLATGMLLVAIVLCIRAYATKNSAQTCWNLIMLANLYGIAALSLAAGEGLHYFGIYSIGAIAAFVAGHACLKYLVAKGESPKLHKYHGSIYSFKELGHIFFIVCLVFMAFPISPSFFVQDILLSSISLSHAYILGLFCVSYILAGISVIRLYTKIFFGPHKSSHHERAYRSS